MTKHETENGADDEYIVKPVYKALQVLLCLGEERRQLSLTEICYRVDLPKTTVYRYLQTMVACGFVAYDPSTELYRLGLRVWQLGGLAHQRLHIREIALPFMQELRNRYNETVNLGEIDGTEVVYIEMVESRHSLRMRAEIGGRDPVYSTSLGKAMLAFIPEEQWQQHLPARLTARTTRTLTTFAALRQDLYAIRERGFAVDEGENEEGSCCVGAPIYNQHGVVIAAISLSAPASRLDERLAHEVGASLIQATRSISFQLGHHGAGK
jgi:IclR family acetate operon transcriptional repressor